VAFEWFKIKNTMPVIDVQISPAGVAFASVTISIINRAEINIVPQDITVFPPGGEKRDPDRLARSPRRHI
jgi:hypothetical protein